MKIHLSFAELHVPLFLGGKNFGQKLDNTKFSGLSLIYDQKQKELWVTHNKKTAIIPTSNIVSMTPVDGKPPVEAAADGTICEPAAKPGKFRTDLSAQVATPTSHVFGE